MKHPLAVFTLIVAGLTPACANGAQPAKIVVKPAADRLRISIDGKPFADYVFRDRKILRPYFANVHGPSGAQVTRNHPPRKGRDSTDHATMHPGVWLAFGDISGADFWRNKARVQHVRFTGKPTVKQGRLTFAVLNHYRDQTRTVCTEVCRHTLLVRPNGYLLTYDSEFRGEKPFAFGDQEEFGLGIRVASKLRVKQGNGRILNADGKRNEKGVRGTNPAWCDYGGSIDGKRAGLVLMPHPGNFRKSWYHARDYGVLVANPFGRHALTGAAQSKVAVQPGETLRLRFGVFLYALGTRRRFGARELEAEYREYLRLFAAKQSPN